MKDAEPIAQDPNLSIKQLSKENRKLKKKLERAEHDLVKLEQVKRNKETLQKRLILELQESQQVLELKSQDLEQTLSELQHMQEKLIESEKLAALGNLVAGVAHEINTPVGTSITLVSTLEDETALFREAIESGKLKRSLFNQYLSMTAETTQLLLDNLGRAKELVQSFKQLSVDQAHLEERKFEVKAYLEGVFKGLDAHLLSPLYDWQIQGEEIWITSYPGLLAQILTNLITNSVTHAFEDAETGLLTLSLCQRGGEVQLVYQDNGRGIPPEHLSQVFVPFFTTARMKGGTGLGLHIVHNLVTQNLRGQIEIESQEGQGTTAIITFPLYRDIS